MASSKNIKIAVHLKSTSLLHVYDYMLLVWPRPPTLGNGKLVRVWGPVDWQHRFVISFSVIPPDMSSISQKCVKLCMRGSQNSAVGMSKPLEESWAKLADDDRRIQREILTGVGRTAQFNAIVLLFPILFHNDKRHARNSPALGTRGTACKRVDLQNSCALLRCCAVHMDRTQ